MEIKVHLVSKKKDRFADPTTFDPKLIYSIREYKNKTEHLYTTVALISGREIDIYETIEQVNELKKQAQ